LSSIVPHAPDAVLRQDTLHVGCAAVDKTVAVKVCFAAAATVTLVGEITRSGGVISTVEATAWDESAFDSAVTVTVLGDGTAFGAVKLPDVVMVPTVEFPPGTPLTSQTTPVFVEKLTDAVNCCVLPALTETVSGEIDIGFAIVTFASAVFEGSDTEIAVTVTDVEVVIVAGAE
jgi:hypothetical protein